MIERISVVMAVYINDNISFFKQAVDSLLNQTYPPSEIIIIADGPVSKEIDDLLVELEKNELFVIEYFSENQGLAIALNTGIRKAKFNLIARMDADDLCKENRFEAQVNYLRNNPDISVLGSWIDEFYGDQSNIISQRKVPKEHPAIMKSLKGRCPFNHPTVMFRKKEILKAGNYQPFFLKEDIYLWLRLAKSGVKFGNIQESLLLFRTTEGMYKRRGGWKYAKSEVNILYFRYQIGIISIMEFIYFCSLTLPVRLAPNWLRGLIYSKLLR